VVAALFRTKKTAIAALHRRIITPLVMPVVLVRDPQIACSARIILLKIRRLLDKAAALSPLWMLRFMAGFYCTRLSGGLLSRSARFEAVTLLGVKRSH